jgi:DNA-binding XRE family transcriptional regulator
MTARQLSADELRTVRYNLELTQAGLAERLGVSLRTIVNWEATGVPARRVPRVERRIGTAIREARECERSVEGGPPCDIADDRLSDALQPFSDNDLLSELQRRAMCRVDTRLA